MILKTSFRYLSFFKLIAGRQVNISFLNQNVLLEFVECPLYQSSIVRQSKEDQLLILIDCVMGNTLYVDLLCKHQWLERIQNVFHTKKALNVTENLKKGNQLVKVFQAEILTQPNGDRMSYNLEYDYQNNPLDY